MLPLLIWLIGLIVLLLLCILQSPRMLLTPQLGFIGCFVPQAVSLFYYLSLWGTDISLNTVVLTLSGVVLFFITSVFFSKVFLGRRKPELQSSVRSMNIDNKQKIIVIEKWKLIAFLIFQLIALLLVIQYYMRNIAGITLTEKIAQYNNVNKFGGNDEIIFLPKPISYARAMSITSSYIFGYILMHSIILKYKQYKLLILLNIIIPILNSALTGGRMGIVVLILTMIVESYIIWGKSHNWKKKIKVKTFLAILIIGCIILAMFPFAGTLLGRASKLNFVDYIAAYVSAPFKNLDIYVKKGEFGSQFYKWETFYNIIQYFGMRSNNAQWVHRHELPFLHLNGYGLGNVYTTFYCFLHDGGIIAFVFFIVFEALFLQWIYKRAINAQNKHGINLEEIFYSYIYSTVLFGFFSDRFYLAILNITTIRMIVFWWLLRLYLTGLRFKNPVKIRKNEWKEAVTQYEKA